MRKPLDKMDPDRYRFVDIYSAQEQKTEYDYLFAIIGFGIIVFIAWVSTL